MSVTGPKRTNNHKNGFTIVELLIVIVVIAILAAISIVAYNGIQQRARDTQRLQDVKTIAKALELYYIQNGVYPSSNCSSNCKINTSWNSTSDGSWANLRTQLVPDYISKLPEDPQASASNPPAIYGGSNYDYVRLSSNCSEGLPQHKYLLTYVLEAQVKKREFVGTCDGSPIANYSSSQYIVVK